MPARVRSRQALSACRPSSSGCPSSASGTATTRTPTSSTPSGCSSWRTPPVGCSCRSFRRRTLFWEESTRPRDPPRMQRRPLARRWLDAGVGAAGGQGALRGRRDIAVGDLAPALETQSDGFLSGQMASGRDTGAVDGVHSGAGEDPRSFTAMLEPRQQDRERARLVRPSPVAARQPQTLADCQASRPGSAPGGCHDLKYRGPPPRTPLWPAGPAT